MFGCYTRNKVDNEMPNLTLANIANACEGTYVGDPSKKQKIITGAVTDSRKVEEGFLFIPIKGERVDGHDFIPSVFEKGALAVLSEHELENPAGSYILVESSTEAMKKLAAFYREGLDIKVVGITGSVGKTSTKEMIASVLSQKYWRDAPSRSNGTAGCLCDHKYRTMSSGKSWNKRRNPAGKDRSIRAYAAGWNRYFKRR